MRFFPEKTSDFMQMKKLFENKCNANKIFKLKIKLLNIILIFKRNLKDFLCFWKVRNF